MEYVHQKKITRKKLFYALVVFFILVVPVVIAYALGYRIDLSRRSLKQVGGVFLKSNVSRTTIFLDNSIATETSFLSKGAVLSGVAPGVHLLRIEKEGYKPWSKTVAVDPSRVIELRNIVLVPRSIPYATSSVADVAVFAPADAARGRFFIDKKGNLVNIIQGNALIAPNVRTFQVVGDQIFFLNQNGFIASYGINDGTLRTLGRPGIYVDSRHPVRFARSSQNDTLVMDSSGGIFAINPEGETRLIDTGAQDMAFDSQGEKLLIVHARSIRLVWFVDNPQQPFQKRFTSEVLLALGSPIWEARWYYGDDAHVIIRMGDGLFLSEIDGRGGRNTVELLDRGIDQLQVTPDIPDALFFRKGKAIYRMNL